MPVLDYFQKVSRGTATTLSSPGYTIGNASVTVGSTTNWPSTGITFAIDTVTSAGVRVAGSYNVFRGTVASATSIDNLTYVGGDTNQNYAAGATTRVYILVSSFQHNRLVDGLLISNDQDGTLKAGAVDVAAVLASDVVTTAKILDANVTAAKIADDVITDAKMATAVKPVTIANETTFAHVASGGVWTADNVGVNLNASMTALVCYINGQRIAVSAVTARAFTLNVDTYIDILNTAGVGSVVYTTAATNAASPALAANSIRIGIIQAAATITATTKVNQGQEDRVFPIASSIPYAVTDSLGNLICPRDPSRRVLGYRQIIVNATSTTDSTSATDMTGLNLTCIIPAGRKTKITGYIGLGSSSVASNAVNMRLYDNTSTAYIATAGSSTNASGDSVSCNPSANSSLSGTRSFKAQLYRGSNAATANGNGSVVNPNYIMVELV